MLYGPYKDSIPVDCAEKFSWSFKPCVARVLRRQIQVSSIDIKNVAILLLSGLLMVCLIIASLASRSNLCPGSRKCLSAAIGSFLHYTSDRWPFMLFYSVDCVFPTYCLLQIKHSIRYIKFLLRQLQSWKILYSFLVMTLLNEFVSFNCLQHFFEMFSVHGLHRLIV